ncbi:hypothetical protein [Mucilaginibacter sp.]|uniref:hypothetical protein n=1 Tax=Mucilaginibacter sp. TaxID=1882438 RepID=UPI0032645D06
MENSFQDFFKDVRKSAILNPSPELGQFFNTAIAKTIIQLKSEMKREQDISKYLSEVKLSDSYLTNGRPNDDDEQYFERQMENSENMLWHEANLTAVAEMRIIYLFKNFEIGVRLLIEQVYKDSGFSDFYKWDSLKNFFKGLGIIMSKISGYAETNELKNVNNQIKHGYELSKDVKGIKEFANAEAITYLNCEQFYKRIHDKVNSFLANLSQAVYDERYEFEQDRIKAIAFEYKNRMDDVALKQLIDELSTNR